MDLCGFDTQFVLVGDARAAVIRFGERLANQWPSLQVSVTPMTSPPSDEDWSTGDQLLQTLDQPKGEAFFVRDEPMVGYFEEHSYTPYPDGTGAIAVVYSPTRFRKASLTVPEDDSGEFRRLSYEATLLLPPTTYSVTLITPGDPSQGGFSGEIHGLLVTSAADTHE